MLNSGDFIPKLMGLKDPRKKTKHVTTCTMNQLYLNIITRRLANQLRFAGWLILVYLEMWDHLTGLVSM